MGRINLSEYGNSNLPNRERWEEMAEILYGETTGKKVGKSWKQKWKTKKSKTDIIEWRFNRRGKSSSFGEND